MEHKAKVLDHGFVILRNMAGPTRRAFKEVPGHPSYPLEEREFDADDTDVPNAARMSFENMDGDRTYEIEMKLARYLANHKHMTPFEAIEVWLEMKLPIFVARQLVRQRTQSINEVSGRYVQLPKEWYIPLMKDVVIQSADKKQGGRPVDWHNKKEVGAAAMFLDALDGQCRQSYELYENAIKVGIAMEQARLFLHLNHYTHWMTKMNLRNLMVTLLSLRDHSHAQPESQKYARATISLLEPHIPGLMKLYQEIFKQLEG